MAGYNKVILIGNLGADPEVRITVASATPCPAASQPAAVSSTSVSEAGNGIVLFLGG